MTSWVFLYAGTVWAFIALGLLFIAWKAARQENFKRHGKLMVLLMLAAWFFVLLYMLRYRFPELLPQIPPEYIPWIALHGTVALFPLVGSLLLVLARWRQRRRPDSFSHLNRHHRRYGRVVIVLWCFTHIGGIINAFLFS